MSRDDELLLEPWLQSGLLVPTDAHVARTLARLGNDDRPEVLLAAALAVRAPRHQHVCVDLARPGLAEPSEEGVEPPVPPEPRRWRATLATSPLVAVRDPVHGGALDEPAAAGAAGHAPSADARPTRPLTLAGDRLYLDRYWRHERSVAARLNRHAADTIGFDATALRAGLDAWFDGPAPDRQRVAAATAIHRRLAVIAGGPGTGKTTTVAGLMALLDLQAAADGRPPPTVALAAPTGKAATRLTAALRLAASQAPATTPAATLARLREATATTLHRLLGVRADHRGRFRHDADHPLPHDVVVVDEASMVSLVLFDRLLEALRSRARLVLLGDPDQLASVESGSVLGDVIGSRAVGPRWSRHHRARLREAVGAAHLDGEAPTGVGPVDDSVVVLLRPHRFAEGSGIATLAAAIRAGDADAVIAGLRAADDVDWLERDPDRPAGDWPGIDTVRAAVLRVAGARVRHARAGRVAAALGTLDELRVLCAHRRGPAGVEHWVGLAEHWLQACSQATPAGGPWYAGRPLLVTANDPGLRLSNGDVGVVVRPPDAGPHVRRVAFPTDDERGWRLLAPGRLPAAEPVDAMTIHKSQGSQFGHVVLVLPDDSPLLTRELLYTALTRARRRVSVLATPAAVRTAVTTPAVRASGLDTALRGRLPPASAR